MIIVVDFGSQTTHLIKRRIEEWGVSAHIIDPENALRDIKRYKPRGIILSGGPASVYEKNAPTVDPLIFDQAIPLLGICYGLQLIAQILGGSVQKGQIKEFGPADFSTFCTSSLFTPPVPSSFKVWMSHGDEVSTLPHGFIAIGSTPTIPFATIAHERKKIYGVQFHPEVTHTQFGSDILANFMILCAEEVKRKTINQSFVDDLVSRIAHVVGPKKAICALSGGVDSSVAAVLSHTAIGHHLTAVYIDSGFMRQGETEALKKVFQTYYKMKIKIVSAQGIFLRNLKGVVNPEKKRRIIGRAFISVLEQEAKKNGARFLIQGTVYPDVIESAGTKYAQKIKSHHNVAGLPKNMRLTLVEPLRNLYKDEVRVIGKMLNLPDAIVYRQPFPGPGLAIRIIGEVTRYKVRIVRQADFIIQKEIQQAGLTHLLWQAFAVFTGIKTTGVRGDARVYGETIAIRCIEAQDAMSAHWSRLPYEVLAKISTRIVNEIPEVNRVVYDVTNKPPGTMEWE